MNELPLLNGEVHKKTSRPLKIIQFGEGNFIRAFFGYFVQLMNESGGFDGAIAAIKPTPRGNVDSFKAQDCLYTVELSGGSAGSSEKEYKLIDSIEKIINPYEDFDSFLSLAKEPSLEFVVSNTTEAGIALDPGDAFSDRPAGSFPAKLTQFLFARYRFFEGAEGKGLYVLPLELTENNAERLRDCIYTLAENWELGKGFSAWLSQSCKFVNTLVDRIVSGFPKDRAEECFRRLGYRDRLLSSAESYALWVLEAGEELKEKLCVGSTGLPLVFTSDHRPYKTRKVRILNGAHTALAAPALLCGEKYVCEALRRENIKAFLLQCMYEEILPSLGESVDEPGAFAADVLRRFENPELRHALSDIALNSVSKWHARCLPSVRDFYERYGRLPERLIFALAAVIVLYKGAEHGSDGSYIYSHNNIYCKLAEKPEIMNIFIENSALSNAELIRLLCEKNYISEDAAVLPGFKAALSAFADRIEEKGCRAAMQEL